MLIISISFTGESSGLNAVLKAFPVLKEKEVWNEKKNYLKALKSDTKSRP